MNVHEYIYIIRREREREKKKEMATGFNQSLEEEENQMSNKNLLLRSDIKHRSFSPGRI